MTTSPILSSLPNRIWAVYEDRDTELVGFSLGWLYPSTFRYVTVRSDTHARLSLRANGYVGVLPLLNGDSLRLLPKIGMRAFGRLITVSQSLDRALDHQFRQFVQLGYNDADDVEWLDLLARSFLRQLATIDIESRAFGRVEKRSRFPYARGRVDATQTSLAVARGDAAPVLCRFKMRTHDVLENRYLALAAWHVTRSHRLSAQERRVALRWAASFDINLTLGEKMKVVTELRRGHYEGSRAYYVPALTLAYLLTSGGASVELAGSEVVQGEPVLLNSANLFESYVREVIARGLAEQGFVVRKGLSPEVTLLTDGSYGLKPDIAISHSGQLRLILDAKYKTGEEAPAPDYYQIFAYAKACEVSTVGLIYPALESEPQASSRTRAAVDGLRVVEFRIPLNSWEATEGWLVDAVAALL